MSSSSSPRDSLRLEKPASVLSSAIRPNQAVHTSVQDEPAPDGGLTAWLQVFGSFFVFFATWGLVNAFGVFQTYYAEETLQHETFSRLSWIGSLQLCLFIIGVIFTGPIFDLGHMRSMLYIGTFLVVFGMMMTSICKQYWQFILAQGLVVGLGQTTLFLPSVALIPAYFERKRGAALGLAATGSSIGAVIWILIFQHLQPKIGFGWATRVIAFGILACLVPPFLTLKMRARPSKVRDLLDPQALKIPAFDIQGLALFIGFIGLYIPFFYVQLYAIHNHVLNPQHLYLEKYLILFLSVGSLFGRLIPAIIADKIGPFNTMVPTTLIAAAASFAWLTIQSDSTAAIIAFCVIYGFFSGGFVALMTLIVMALCPDLSRFGTRSGMLSVPSAAGLLIGNPIAGALVGDSYVRLQVFCGVMLVASAIVTGVARLALTRPKLWAKA